MAYLRLALIGFGNVGRAFTGLLDLKKGWLKTHGLKVDVVAVSTASRGALMSDDGLDMSEVLNEVEKGNTFHQLTGYTDASTFEVIESCGADIMLELTPLDIENGQPAVDHIKTTLKAGMSVITTNKGPLSFAYEELKALADSRRVAFRFEGTVLGGTPVFSLHEGGLHGCKIKGISGILNCTSSFILGEMSKGVAMEEALKEAHRLGVAEADASMDVDGWDAAAKISTLANVLMGADLNLRDVARKGIRDINLDQVRDAAANNEKIMLVARAEQFPEGVGTSVRPEKVKPDSPFWSLNSGEGAVTLETELAGNVTIIGYPDLASTAYSIYSDMLTIAGFQDMRLM